MQELFDGVEKEKFEFMNERQAQYMKNGLTEIMARAAAADDLKKYEEQKEAAGEEAWNSFTKAVDMSSILDDFIRRGLAEYKVKWQKINAPQTIDFKLHLKTDDGGLGPNRNIKGRLIAGASLILERAVNGVWRVWSHKHISFQHIGEMRQGHVWKTELYQSMLFDFIELHNNHRLIIEDVQNTKKE